MQTLNNVKISLNFNVRQPNKKTATSPIYCVVKIDGKQLKVPTGLKVYGYQWDKSRQQCTINTNMVASDQANNVAANRVINAVRCAYDELFVYLCSDGDTYTATEIEQLIKETITAKTDNDMSNPNAIPPKRTITATTLVKRAFDVYYPATTKASTLQQNENRLKRFVEYVKASKKGDTPKNHLTQDGINDYREYLLNESLSPAVINELCSLIVRLINDVLTTKSEFRKHNITPVRFVRIKKNAKQSESKKTDLTLAEVQALRNCNELTPREREYRDLFIMQVETGVRVSDLPKLFNGDYKTMTNGDTTTLSVYTQKEGITAAIIVTPTIAELQERYKDGFTFVDFGAKAFKGNYNNNLKTISRKAGLDRVIEYVDPQGNKKAEPLCDIISNHFARHTFITHKLREGYTPTEVSKMSGHADARMIESIYQHLTDEDKAKAVVAAQKRVQAKQQASSSDSDTDSAIIAEQARENHKQRKTIASQRQMIAIEQQRRVIAESLKDVENESVKELLQLVQMHIENGDVEEAQNVLQDVIKFGAGVQLLSDEEAAEFEM